ncbi:zinc finger CCCH domain-containing protein 18-like [Gigantopelta aegis]|uniref:zinc finger CCCH domain-containing protein 18-like n=1 Tax=Gigantopelta aegis TaxID=1735272 RepID=UPI001B88CFFA|nr:zinc finger CCCH domain-containing protein 18-like [Gigantopelta aegis]
MEAEECMETDPGSREDDSSDCAVEPTISELAEVEDKTSMGPQAVSPDGVRSSGITYSDLEEGEESMEEGEVDDSSEIAVSLSHLADPSVHQGARSPSQDECSRHSYDTSHSTGIESHPMGSEKNEVQTITPDTSPPHFQENESVSFSNKAHEDAHCTDRPQKDMDEGPSPSGDPEDLAQSFSDGPCPASPEGECPASPDEECPASPDGECPASPDGECPASPEGQCPASPEGQCPASSEVIDPASSEGECPASDGECPASEGECPASPEGEDPTTPEGEGLSSQYENIASLEEESAPSPDDEGPASPEDEELASLEGDCPASPDDVDPASLDDEGPGSPQIEGSVSSKDGNEHVASPQVEGVSSDEEGETSTTDDDGVPTSSLNSRNIDSRLSGSKADDIVTSAAGPEGTDAIRSGLSLTHHQASVIQESANSPAVQDISDLSCGDSCSVKQNSEHPSSLIDKDDCVAASPDSRGDVSGNLLELPLDSRNSKSSSISQWPSHIASSPISDTEEIWDNPSILENKSNNDDSGSCVKCEKQSGESEFQRKYESTVLEPSLGVSDTLSTTHSVSISHKKRKTRKEIGLRHDTEGPQAAKTNLDISENISSSTDTVHNRDHHLHTRLDRCSISRDRKEHRHDRSSSTKKTVDSSPQDEAVAVSTTHDGGGDEGRMKRAKENTSFSEEHVELDYEEDVADDMHAHHNDISKDDEDDADGKKEGSDDEKQEGEITDDDNDDGEIDEEEDCEEGEIREPGFRRQSAKPICRFFLRGSCTWGLNCRFLHPGINDKGNYRLIEMPGFHRVGPMGPFGPIWASEMPEEPEPPPPPELPPTESAWERGLRHAKELRKKAQEKKEQETDFEEKRLNLSLDEERELNKENERSKYTKDPYYDQQAFEDDEYYSKPQVTTWQPGQYENFEVRWTRGPEYPPFREEERPGFKERPFSLHMDRVERPVYPPRQRHERRHDKWHHDKAEMPHPTKHVAKGRQADEWHDPWQRTKSPVSRYRGSRSDSRSRRRSRRSYSVSSRGSSSSYSTSRSRSSSVSSRSSRSSYSRSSSYSSRSPTPSGTARLGKHGSSDQKKQPAQQPKVNSFSSKAGEKRIPPAGKPNAVKAARPPDKRQPPPTKAVEQPRSAVSLTIKHKQRYPDKPLPSALTHSPVKQARAAPTDVNNRARRPEKVPPPLANKLRPRSVSTSASSVSRSRSRSSSSSFSRSRSRSMSSVSSRSSSSGSTTSSGSADSDHLYRDLQKGQNGEPAVKKVPDEKKPPKAPLKEVRRPRAPEHQSEHRPRKTEHRPSGRQSSDSRLYNSSAGYRHQSGRAPATPVKPKDPMKLVGQKQSIKLLLVSKGSEKGPPSVPGLPGLKRRASDQAGPPAKRPPSVAVSAVNKPVAGDKPTKPTSVVRSEKAKSPPVRPKVPVAQMKAPLKPSSQAKVPTPTKPAVPGPVPPPVPEKPKIKKSTLSRREELLKQLKAVEDAIARKKSKMT